MHPIPIIFIDANTTFRQLAIRVFERHFAAEIVFVGEADQWPPSAALSGSVQAVLLGLGAEGLVDPRILVAIQAAMPGIPVIVLGHLDEPPYATAALSAGAAAFISKDEIGDKLIPTLRRLSAAAAEP
jgi:DNA-binding NarL/FixJ family response regulator